MACINYKNCNYKSAIRTYNNTTQTVTEALTTINLLGSICTDTGCSISATTSAINICSKGLYYIAGDITFTPTAAGALVFQLYNGTTAIPCAIATDTAEADNIVNMHIETELVFTPCCNSAPSLNLKVSGVAGDVNWVGMTVRKDA